MSTGHQLIAGGLFLVTAALLMACGAAQSPAGPDIDAALNATTRQTAQIDSIQIQMADDLDQFVSLRSRFLHAGIELNQPPFPIEQFRFVVVSCLNEESNAAGEQPGNTVPSAELLCRPTFLDDLLLRLEQVPPERRRTALEMLKLVDELRQVRSTLRHRIARIPQTIRTSQGLLEDQRAELRQAQAELERRRPQYSSSDWRAAQTRLEDFRTELSRLEDAIEALTVAYPDWPRQLDGHVSGLYMDLAGLR
ncbi:MAG: hypothetical protein H0U74_21265 [Bradymonadaceae bacterium]|nr:hypothetical protein [Lujinxingiaceae bacterium]